MKRFVVAGLGFLALAAMPASAADLPRGSTYRAPAYAPQYNWTGFYLGINGGGGFGDSNWNGFAVSNSPSGGMIGGTAGYNWQGAGSPWVFGLEGDIDWTNIKASTACAGLNCQTKNNWLGTVRGRVGYAFDRFLPYFTGGLALGDINATRPGFPGGSITNAGWTVGAGLEVGLVSNVSLKAEYLYVDLGTFNLGINCALAPGGNVSFTTSIFRAGANVRF